MLLAALHCCIICRNSGVSSRLALALLHFMQDFSIWRFYGAVLLHFLQDFSIYSSFIQMIKKMPREQP
ncbi:hypothetical protein J2Z70_004070 [Paenibacillus silagei]|uniref:CPBP family intramembrane metalloprotease n=1 Tax=Paenibacillus silagei TaxID=1670801 RepID=A0ABS4NV38_9BACL|nr:hypothetical protein [Paenibacillus silagei]